MHGIMAGEQNKNETSEEVVLSNTVKLTNLVYTTSTSLPCRSCGSRNVCYYLGQPGHGRAATSTSEPSDQFYSKGSIHWKFEGQICFSIEANSSFHLFVSLSPGMLEDGWVELSSKFELCPNSHTQYGQLPKDVKECLLYIIPRDSKHATEVKVLKFDIGSTVTGWNDLSLKNKCFMPVETLKTICQVSSEEAFPEIGTSEAFEFIDMDVQLKLSFKHSTPIGKSAQCFPQNLWTVKEKTHIFKNFVTHDDEDGKNDAGAADDDGLTTSTKKFKYTDFITLKVDCEEKGESIDFQVHKYLLTQNSEVFEKMLETNMQEKKTNQVVLSGVTPATVEAFVGCLYGDYTEARKDAALLCQILTLAHCYQLNCVMEKAFASIIATADENLEVNSALEIFATGDRLELSDLKFRAMQWIVKHKQRLCSIEGRHAVEEFFKSESKLYSSFVAQMAAFA